LEKMRTELFRWMRETGDVGLVPEPELAEMMRPNGKWQKTAKPHLIVLKQTENRATVELRCPTEGTSIAYRIDADGKEGRWQLYTKPVTIRKGETLVAKACRLGCFDSDEVTWRSGEPVLTTETPEPIPDWRAEIDRSGVLERLLTIKQLDGQGKVALSAYEKALKDESPAVRYWAIVGIHHAVEDHIEREKWRTVLLEALNDPSPTVKVAAAHALCDWGEVEKGLTVLTELLSHQNEFVRLYAINALRHLGEKAKPALPTIEKALKDPSGYVQRVARTILKRFGKRT
jgi:hypothetical protein